MIPLIWFILVIGHAVLDWYKIRRRNININHFRESCWFAFICLVVALIILGVEGFSETIGSGWRAFLPLILFPLLTRAAFFDPLLNILLDKGLLYEPRKKPQGNGSWWDQFERWIGLPVWVYRVVYLAGYLVYLIFYLS